MEVLQNKGVSYKFNGSPIVGIFDEKFVLQSQAGEALKNIPYVITNKATGEQIRGTTDEEGATIRAWTEHEEEVVFELDYLELIVDENEENS